MSCERVLDLLLEEPASGSALELESAQRHLATCENCQSAFTAVELLERDRVAALPAPSSGAFERAMLLATHQAQLAQSNAAGSGSRRFLLGMIAGGALAAGVAGAVIMLTPLSQSPLSQSPQSDAVPGIELALNETRAVSISLDSSRAIEDAEIHVVLTGAIALEGYEGQSELRWRTALDAGSNQLTLPLISSGSTGGQVLVEVQHEAYRRVFVIDVSAPG